jgi:hypothetical protein
LKYRRKESEESENRDDRIVIMELIIQEYKKKKKEKRNTITKSTSFRNLTCISPHHTHQSYSACVGSAWEVPEQWFLHANISISLKVYKIVKPKQPALTL